MEQTEHVVVPKGEDHDNGPVEEGIGDIDRMTKTIMVDKNIPSRFWDIVTEHCVLLNAVISPTVDEPTKTIFRQPTENLQTMMMFLQLYDTLSGSSKSNIAKFCGLVSLIRQVFSLATLPKPVMKSATRDRTFTSRRPASRLLSTT